MPGRVGDHREVSPRVRVREDGPDADGHFYPREAVEILRAQDLDYRQVKRLFCLVREQAGWTVPAGWARFSLLDLAAARVALELAASPGSTSRRLQLEVVRRACVALRRQGVDNPLLDVRMERSGRVVYAVIDGQLVDPTSEQLAISWTVEAVGSFLIAREATDALEAVKSLRRAPRRVSAPVRVPID